MVWQTGIPALLSQAHRGSEIEFELRLVARRISLLCDEREDRKGQATGSGRAAEAAAAAAGADTRERGNEGSQRTATTRFDQWKTHSDPSAPRSRRTNNEEPRHLVNQCPRVDSMDRARGGLAIHELCWHRGDCHR